ncbi:MAG: hypothetical protein FWD60_08690 [Candidatus Azobacteroides sp.]|nr:hypothetical protein [Candidatus Azobacteroides sp.]
MLRGSQNGISNNPAGKPAGANQKITLSVRKCIVDKIRLDVEKYFEELNALRGKDYVRCMTELLKLIIPRPLNEEESNVMNINSELIKRLFNK